MEDKTILKITECTLKGKVIKESVINLDNNVTDEEAEELFNMIAPIINCRNDGSYISDTYVYYSIIRSKINNVMRNFL